MPTDTFTHLINCGERLWHFLFGVELHPTLPHLQRPQAAGTSAPIDINVKVLTLQQLIRPVKPTKHNIQLFPTYPRTSAHRVACTPNAAILLFGGQSHTLSKTTRAVGRRAKVGRGFGTQPRCWWHQQPPTHRAQPRPSQRGYGTRSLSRAGVLSWPTAGLCKRSPAP